MSFNGPYNSKQQQQQQRQQQSRQPSLNQHDQHPRRQSSLQSPERYSNNPFISQTDLSYSNALPNSIPVPQPPQSHYSETHPISVTDNGPYDYSHYDMNPSTPITTNYPSGAPLLHQNAQWASPSTMHSTAGPLAAQVQSPNLSSNSSSDTPLHSKLSTLSPISPDANDKRILTFSPAQTTSKYEPQNPVRTSSPSDMAKQRKQSFAVDPAHDVINLDSTSSVDPSKFKIYTDTEEVFDDEQLMDDDRQIMKRHRVATQRHVKGRPNAAAKRSKSIFGKKAAGKEIGPPTPQLSNFAPSIMENNVNEGSTPHKVYFNLPLPSEMTDPESGAPLTHYPRNKVRTTKYTPLSFVPKNLYFQFKNVANIYFLFIVILGVSEEVMYFFFTNILGISHLWRFIPRSSRRSHYCHCSHHFH